MLLASPLVTLTALTAGGVASYWRENDPDALLPAWSVQMPPSDAASSPGPGNVSEVQPAMPEVASLPCQPTATGWLYQPFASGGRAAPPVMPVGGSASILIVVVSLDAVLLSASFTAHVRVVPAWGPGIWTAF